MTGGTVPISGTLQVTVEPVTPSSCCPEQQTIRLSRNFNEDTYNENFNGFIVGFGTVGRVNLSCGNYRVTVASLGWMHTAEVPPPPAHGQQRVLAFTHRIWGHGEGWDFPS
jgi:hypothetical protein